MMDKDFIKSASSLSSPTMGTEAIAPFLYNLVMLHRPRRILEIGGGLTTLYLLKGLADCNALIEVERHSAEVGVENVLLNKAYYGDSLLPARMHMIDNFVHSYTTASKVVQTAKDLGIDKPLTVHEKDFIGYADKLPKEDLPFDMVWFDCGNLEYYQHFQQAFWPLVNRNGGLILIHSLATNFHGQIFLSNLKLSQATKSFSEFELMTFKEPHKFRQNSITCIRLIGDLRTQFHSVMP